MPIFWSFADPSTPPPISDSGKAAASDLPTDAPENAEEVVEEEEVRDEVKKTVLGLMPWAISLTVHAAVVLMAVFVIYTIQMPREREREIVPLANLVANPGSLSQTQTEQTERSAARRNTQTPETTPSQTEIQSPQVTTSTVIAATGGSSSMANPFDGDTGDTASPFAGARMFGEHGGNVRRIVYMVDASGSLIDTLPFVINELNDAIGRLSGEQSFSVIFFQDAAPGGFIEVPGVDRNNRAIRGGLRPATTRNKTIVREWLAANQFNIIPQGRSDPRTALVPALRAATSWNPELIFLLSDNIIGQQHYEINRADLVEAVTSMAGGRIKINTIQFIYPETLGGVPTLRQIADKTGGIYKFFSADDLRISRY